MDRPTTTPGPRHHDATDDVPSKRHRDRPWPTGRPIIAALAATGLAVVALALIGVVVGPATGAAGGVRLNSGVERERPTVEVASAGNRAAVVRVKAQPPGNGNGNGKGKGPNKTTTTTTTTTTSSTTATTTPPPGTVSTADVIDPDDPSVLFFSDNEGCAGIPDGRAHPDWIEGQSNSSLNSDGTSTYGFAYNTGDSTTGQIDWGFEEQPFALSGDCVAFLTINDAYGDKRAIRLFRRYDDQGRTLPTEAYYSVWLYFPENVAFDEYVGGHYGFRNVFQIKNKVAGDSLATLSINASMVNGEDQFMSFSIWNKAACGAVEDCSGAYTVAQQTPMAIPVGQWVHLEMHHRASADNDGRAVLWQDGEVIIDFTGPTERAGTERRNWSVNNYGRLHVPASHTLFADDPLIATNPVHPLLFD